jgi:hypothetical protein
MKQHNSGEWTKYMYIAQYQVNNRPSKSRDISSSPYEVYFGRANKSMYESMSGSAYKAAKTEYGLRLAAMVLSKVKEVDCQCICTHEEVSDIIKAGDRQFYQAAESISSSDMDYLKSRAAIILQMMNYNVSVSELDEPSMSNENSQENQASGGFLFQDGLNSLSDHSLEGRMVGGTDRSAELYEYEEEEEAAVASVAAEVPVTAMVSSVERATNVPQFVDVPTGTGDAANELETRVEGSAHAGIDDVEHQTAAGAPNIEECHAVASLRTVEVQPATSSNDYRYETQSENSNWAYHWYQPEEGAPHLKVGDMIEYYHPAGVAGKKENLRQATIVSIDLMKKYGLCFVQMSNNDMLDGSLSCIKLTAEGK